MSRYANAWEIQYHDDGMIAIIFRHELMDGDEMMEPIVLTPQGALTLGNELTMKEPDLPSAPTPSTPSSPSASDETPQEMPEENPSPLLTST